MNYYNSLQHHSKPVKEALISEAPHTSFKNVPDEFAFFRGKSVDLGFESLGLDEQAFRNIMLGFIKNGIRIPGTNYRIRADNTLKSTFELVGPDTEIPVLPEHWLDAVLIMGDGNEVVHAGDAARKHHQLKLVG
jgi:hypothetical protein